MGYVESTHRHHFPLRRDQTHHQLHSPHPLQRSLQPHVTILIHVQLAALAAAHFIWGSIAWYGVVALWRQAHVARTTIIVVLQITLFAT